jgi:hypothetical protein
LAALAASHPRGVVPSRRSVRSSLGNRFSGWGFSGSASASRRSLSQRQGCKALVVPLSRGCWCLRSSAAATRQNPKPRVPALNRPVISGFWQFAGCHVRIPGKCRAIQPRSFGCLRHPRLGSPANVSPRAVGASSLHLTPRCRRRPADAPELER